MKMKKMVSRLSRSIVLVLVLSITLSITVFAANGATDLDLAQARAMQEVEVFVSSDNILSSWNETTKIGAYTILYTLDNTAGGYIFDLETDGKPSGYIQVGKTTNGFEIINMGFEGDNLLKCAVSANADKNVQVPSKVYYAGNFDYLMYNESNELINISSGEQVQLNEARNEYAAMQTRLNIGNSVVSTWSVQQTNTTTKVLTNLMSSHLKTVSAYSGYSNHCSPTAGTNVILYWAVSRGHTDLGTIASTIFSELRTAMQHSNDTGTDRTKIYPAIVEYIVARDSSQSLISSADYSVTYAEAQNAIDNGRAVLLSVANWEEDVAHSINVWGYTTVSGTNYLYMSDNFGASTTFELINFSAYDFPLMSWYGFPGE